MSPWKSMVGMPLVFSSSRCWFDISSDGVMSMMFS